VGTYNLSRTPTQNDGIFAETPTALTPAAEGVVFQGSPLRHIFRAVIGSCKHGSEGLELRGGDAPPVRDVVVARPKEHLVREGHGGGKVAGG
jgi:hypothetical protein